MSVCPFCKAQVAQSTAPCPRCGKLAAEHPSIAAISGRTLSTDFDEDEPAELSLEAGASVGQLAAAAAGGAAFESGKGVTLDDDLFGGDENAGPLELDVPDLPAPPEVPAARRSDPRIDPPPAGAPAPAPSSGKLPVGPPAPPPPASSSGRFAVAPDSSPELGAAPPPPPPSPHDQAAARIANYPTPPDKIWQAPRYALSVLYRKVELRQDLESLRRKRSPDVRLYERALASHDPRMYTMGLAITAVAVFLAALLFFMPVIKRFAFAPD